VTFWHSCNMGKSSMYIVENTETREEPHYLATKKLDEQDINGGHLT
jgi:hypothetical protein